MKKLIKWSLVFLAALALSVPEGAWATGACTCARFNDFCDHGCHKTQGGFAAPPSNAKNAGGNNASCPTCPPLLAGPDAPDITTGNLGMPRWWVDEPYINLHVADIPLSYTASSGQTVAFQWLYKQRFTLPAPDQVPALYTAVNGSYGPRYYGDIYLSESCLFNATSEAYYYGHMMTNAVWMHNYMSHVLFWDATWENEEHFADPSFSDGNYEALVFNSDGGVDYYNPNGTIATNELSAIQGPPISGTLLIPQYSSSYPTVSTPTPDGSGIYWGNATNGFRVLYPDGSQDVYGLTYWLGQDVFDTSAEALLTEKVDPQGRITKIGYQNVPFFTNVCNGYWIVNESPPLCLRVRYVVDSDGRTNTFTYQTSSSDIFQVSQITDPFGRTASFGYGSCGTSSAGWLTSITDAANNTSTFTYASTVDGHSSTNSGWMSSLITPYGTTTFSFYDVFDSSTTNGFQTRAALVGEPDGANQLFLYQHNTSSSIESSAAPPSVPGYIFDNGTNGGADEALFHRNSFHWDRRQYANLSSGALSSLSGSGASGVSSLSSNDYYKGQMQHWLLDVDEISITETLSSERDPSPDAGGTIEGSRTWYGYTGSPPADVLVSPQIGCIAQLLPNGTNYTLYTYNDEGLVTKNVQSYSLPNGAIGQLTNAFTYANTNYFGFYRLTIDVTNISNSMGQHVNIKYNGYHEPVAITNALNQVTTLGYDSGTYNLTNVALYTGRTIGLTYNAASPVSSSSAFLNQITLQPEHKTNTIVAYSGPLPQIIHVAGTGLPDLWLTNTWDGLNRLTGTTYQDSTTSSNIYTILDLTAKKDRLGNWTEYAYDSLQHLTTITDARTNITQLTWCECGSLTSISNALGNITSNNYNNQELLTNVNFPDGSSMNWQYDLLGRVTNSFDGSGKSLKYTYNNQSIVTSVSTAYGQVLGTYYDALGHPVTVTNANNVVVTNAYDLLNRITNRAWTGGGTENFGYATNGLIAYTNQDGQWTQFGRDGSGRMTAMTNAAQTNLFGYDALDDLISLTDGLNNTTTWNYNQYGWLTNKANALGTNIMVYSYDAGGRVTNRAMIGTNTGYTYDAVGNLKTIIYPQLTISNFYDAINELTNMIDGVGTNKFTYTATGQLASETAPWTNNTVSFGYYQGHRTNLSLTQPSASAWTQTYAYDAEWRMTNIASPAGAFNYTYATPNPASALISGIALPNGASIANTYDSLARLTGTALANQFGHVLDGYVYGLDALGLRTNITRNLGLTTNTVAIAYDGIDQLTNWSAKESGGALRHNEQLSYAYDAAGNLHTRTNDALVQTFNVDALNQISNVVRTGPLTVTGATPVPATNVTIDGVAAQTYGDFTFAGGSNTLANGANTFTIVAQNLYGVAATNSYTLNLYTNAPLQYDANGNLTNDGTRVFSYDAENQLTNVFATNAWRVGFVYDGLNRRRISRNYTWQSSAWLETNEIHYIYDGNLVLQERDTNNNPQVTYTRGLDLSLSRQGAGGIGGLLARTDANGSTFYHSDGSGNIAALMDVYQNIVARYRYDAYGKLLGRWGMLADANHYRFSSEEFFSNPGIYGYARRFYEPNFQRWMNRDPIGETGGNNLYGFVGNTPINRVDPFGLYEQFGNEPSSATISDDLYAAQMAAQLMNQLLASLANATYVPGNGIAGAEMEGPFERALQKEMQGAASDLLNNLEKLKPSCPEKPLRRPYVRKATRQAVEANAPRTPDGKPIDPNTLQPIEGTPDLGHTPGNENWRAIQQAEADGMSQPEFNDFMNNPDFYQLEDPSANRSRRYEKP